MNNRFWAGALIAFGLLACGCKAKPEMLSETEMPVAAAAVIAAAPEADECLSCHTDKQRLIDTAKPEEVKVKESSGAG